MTSQYMKQYALALEGNKKICNDVKNMVMYVSVYKSELFIAVVKSYN